MIPNAYRGKLREALNAGGSETIIYVDSLETINGETLDFSKFTPYRGILTIDPYGEYPEWVSFTGINTTNNSFTGVTRGLSALDDTVIAGNKFFHPEDTDVVLAWGTHNILDIPANGGGAVDSVNGQTGVVVLTTTDIADATNKRYITDAQQTVLGNTSNTNSGDNATNTQYSGLVTNATHTGDAEGATALTVKRINGVALSGLATGILKNTTTTGVPSIAINSDLPVMTATVGGAVPTPPNNTTTFLRGDGTFATPAGGGTVTSVTSANADATVATTTTTPVITIVSAPKLTTARTIAGVSFDGTTNISLNNNAITNGAGYTTNTGTVTSVSATVPTGLSISGSPITTTGTLGITYTAGYQGYTTTEATKLSNITITQAVNLDTLESDTTTNNAKVTNATHTGDVTGATALTVDKTAITGKTAVTAVGTDYVLISDTSDTGNLKKALISDFAGSTYTQPRSTRMGWVFPDNTINGATDIAANKWHTISAMWYELTTAGDFLKRDTSGYGSNFYYTAANALIVRQNCTVALINISSGNATYVNALTASSTKRSALITEMISFCQTNNFDGVDLDLETFQVANMSASQWTDFKTLLQELGDALHAKGLILSMEVPPIWNTAANTESGTGDAWDSANSQGYYRMTYGELNYLPVDQVVIMAYDYQYDYSAGEPNQPLKWFKEILNFARNNINEDRIKIVGGIPSAGYSGTTGGYSTTGRTYDYLSVQTGFGGASRDANSGELIWANAGTSYACIDDTAIGLKVTQAEEVGIFAHALWHIGDNKYGTANASVLSPEQKKLNTVQVESKSITIETPTATEDISMFYTDDAITITKIVFAITGSTSVTTTIRQGTDRSATGTEVVIGGTVANSTTTGNVVTTFNDATVPADSFIWLETTALSGTPTSLNVTIFYKRD